MTAQETQRVAIQPAKERRPTAPTRSAGKAYDRRIRREQLVSGRRLTATGSPLAATLSRVPYVAVIILLLAGGIVGVLWLNTMSDAAGLRAGQSRLAQMELDTKIEAAQKDIAALKNPALLDVQARSLGLVPPSDAAMLEIGTDGKVAVIGSPAPAGVISSAAATTAAPLPTTSAAAKPVAPKQAALPTTPEAPTAGATAGSTTVRTTAATSTGAGQ